MIFSLFKCQEDIRTDPVGVPQGFEPRGVFFPLRMAEVIGHPAQGQNQIIKRQQLRRKLQGLLG